MSFDESELSILNDLEDMLDMPKTVNESTEMVSLESVAKQVVAENSSPEYLFWKSRVDADLFKWVDDPVLKKCSGSIIWRATQISTTIGSVTDKEC